MSTRVDRPSQGTHAKIISIEGISKVHDTKCIMNNLANSLKDKGYSVLCLTIPNETANRNCYEYEYNRLLDCIYSASDLEKYLTPDRLYKLRMAFMSMVNDNLKFNHVEVRDNKVIQSVYDFILINNFVVTNYIQCAMLYTIRKSWCLANRDVQYRILNDFTTFDDAFLKILESHNFYSFKPDMIVSCSGLPYRLTPGMLDYNFKNDDLNMDMVNLYSYVYCNGIHDISSQFSDNVIDIEYSETKSFDVLDTMKILNIIDLLYK